MTTFDNFARRNETQPVFRLLYVGSAHERSSGLLETIRARRVFDKVETIEEIPKNLDLVRDAIRRHLQPGGHIECVILVFDLGPESSGRAAAALLAEMPPREPWGSQVVGYVLVGDDSRISFDTFVEAVAHDMAGVGDSSSLLQSIETWCRPYEDSVVGLNLGLACQLNPSWWIRGIGHDYLAKIGTIALREALVAAELWNIQQEIDFWQVAIKNVLVFPHDDRPTRRIADDAVPSGDEPLDRIEAAPCRLLVPEALHQELLAVDWSRCQVPELVVWESGQTLLAKEQTDAASILVYDPTMTPHEMELPDGVSALSSRVMVSESEVQQTWSEWQAAFARNTVGAFRIDDFLGRIPGRSLVVRTKLPYWKVLCFVSLRSATDRMMDLMSQTYGFLDERSADGLVSATRLLNIWRAIVQVHCARGIYFDNAKDS